jgi:HEAT repeat protein
MTPDQRALVLALVVVPGRPALGAEPFLTAFDAQDGEALGLTLLRDAVARRDPVDVELALVVCFRFGLSQQHRDLLHVLASADWHRRHEDVVTALGRLRSPDCVDALLHLAGWVPDYLDFDEARALATEAVWALGSIEGAAAREALEALTEDRDPIVSGGARAQLERRDRCPSDDEVERRPVEPPGAHESRGGTGPTDV